MQPLSPSDARLEPAVLPVIRTWIQKIPQAWRFSLLAWSFFFSLLNGMSFLALKRGWVYNYLMKYFLFEIEQLGTGWAGFVETMWVRYDAVHYIRIATDGYSLPDLSAFFPLFPLLGRITGLVTGNLTVGLILVSNLSLILACVLLYRLTEEIFDQDTAQRAVVCLLIYPFMIFLFTPFTESLSLLLILLSYFALRRKQWVAAIAAGFAAGLTRGTVVPLSVLVIAELWHNRRSLTPRQWAAGLAAAAAPLLGVAAFLLWRRADGFPPYNQMQIQYWQRHFAWPLETLLLIPQRIQEGYFPLVGYVNLATLAGLLLLTVWMLRRLPVSLALYQAVSFLFIITTTRAFEPFASAGRYSLILFPTYIALALWADTPRKRMAGFAFSLAWMLLIAGQYFTWGWVG